nr:MAG TPA: hypothetical protein [Caudoviricetes sp.]
MHGIRQEHLVTAGPPEDGGPFHRSRNSRSACRIIKGV